MSSTDERSGDARDDTRAIAAADGDDIVVIPGDGADAVTRPRGRPFLIGVATLAILVVVGVVAYLARDTGTSPRVQTTAPGRVPTLPVVAKTPRTTVVRKTPQPNAAATTIASTRAPAPSVTSPTAPRNIVPPGTIATAPPTVPATVPPPPKQYGATVLTWDAPRSLTIKAGKTATLAVTAHNGTDGTVTLPHPLACTPRLDGHGVCTEVAQLIGSGQSASARYTIDAHGITPGHYSLSIEGVLTVSVTVT